MGLDIFGGGEATSALMGLGSNIIGNMMSYKNAKKLMDRQNSFVERMSNTAYSRATADMRSAGLNPALMYGNGSAASTPSGGMASTPDFDIQNPMQSAMEYRNAKATIANTEASAAYNRELAETEKNRRANLDADSALKTSIKIATDTKLPYETRKMAAEAKNLISQSMLNDEIRKFVGMDSVSKRIQANAASRSAEGSYYYDTHRALGFSESDSETTSHTKPGLSGSLTKTGLSGGRTGRSRTHTRSHSRTY
ncbi:DNA pilot protein [Dipodfec virus UOA04_Rod_771]|nr:DNA pilot protein [Dipodfec virus UOA04_Rod_771]